MHEESLISLQQYAIMHKLSTFAVVKLVNAKKLKTIKKMVNGEEKEFIIDNSILTQKPMQAEKTSSKEKPQPAIDYEVEFHKLLAKYIELHEKYIQILEEKNNAPQ